MTFKGQPVAGMAVWVHIPTAAFNRSIKTDARGEALLTNIEPATYEFFGKDPGHLAKATATVKAAETTELKVEATGAGGILGKLKTTQRGCSVHVVAVNAPRGRPAGAYYPVAADGSFSIESLEPGEYSAAPSCGTRKSAETKLMVKAGEVTQLALAED
jgi:hypothetical protein